MMSIIINNSFKFQQNSRQIDRSGQEGVNDVENNNNGGEEGENGESQNSSQRNNLNEEQPAESKNIKRKFKIPKYLKVITDGSFYGEVSAKEIFQVKMGKSKKKVEEYYGALRGSSKKLTLRKQLRASKVQNIRSVNNLDNPQNSEKNLKNFNRLKNKHKSLNNVSKVSKVMKKSTECKIRNTKLKKSKKNKSNKFDKIQKNKPNFSSNNIIASPKKLNKELISQKQVKKAITLLTSKKSISKINQDFLGQKRKSIEYESSKKIILIGGSKFNIEAEDEKSYISE